MASITALPSTVGGPAAAPLPRPAARGGVLRRGLVALVRHALAGRRLRALDDRQLRDIGLARADVADPFEACPPLRAWSERGSAGWTVDRR